MSDNNKKSISYSDSGVNYDSIDPIKKLAQSKAKETSKNLNTFNMSEVAASRGESAFVWEEEDSYKAFVIEGLGTKNLIADEVRKLTNKTYYDQIAQDTIAMIVNDLIVVGALPLVINAYFAAGSSEWFEDEQRSKDLIDGWAKACEISGATWGGGETPPLKDIILPDAIDLSGAAIGIIKPKTRLILGDKIKAGDTIVLIESSGIHSNGMTLARKLVKNLNEGYATKLSDGTTFGETLLTPTHIYVPFVKQLLEENLDIHYMVNITGHGWRKLMRANRDFSYIINEVPNPQPIFEFIQENSGNSDEDMYGYFNMGAGFAVIVSNQQAEKVIEIAAKKNLKAWSSGVVENGPRKVFINAKRITFERDTLNLR